MTLSPLKNLFIFTKILSAFNRWGVVRSSRRLGDTHILLMKRSLFTGRPFLPSASRGVSVHISLTFSRTMLQWRSNALTRARSLRLLRMEMRTCTCERTAVWRIDSGPAENSCSSSWAISYSL